MFGYKIEYDCIEHTPLTSLLLLSSSFQIFDNKIVYKCIFGVHCSRDTIHGCSQLKSLCQHHLNGSCHVMFDLRSIV